ncbi:unnamed protein product [Caenorhabditis auriculariae]|uniref:Uncharacterized protein n=1 Tax=Caenorhabditis auriculariae TaxID=2777116 RepID=A0A8S1H1E4_9PELO|nr:unnamed protein product [Caenorhabditis auriculariae]
MPEREFPISDSMKESKNWRKTMNGKIFQKKVALIGMKAHLTKEELERAEMLVDSFMESLELRLHIGPPCPAWTCFGMKEYRVSNWELTDCWMRVTWIFYFVLNPHLRTYGLRDDEEELVRAIFPLMNNQEVIFALRRCTEFCIILLEMDNKCNGKSQTTMMRYFLENTLRIFRRRLQRFVLVLREIAQTAINLYSGHHFTNPGHVDHFSDHTPIRTTFERLYFLISKQKLWSSLQELTFVPTKSKRKLTASHQLLVSGTAWPGIRVVAGITPLNEDQETPPIVTISLRPDVNIINNGFPLINFESAASIAYSYALLQQNGYVYNQPYTPEMSPSVSTSRNAPSYSGLPLPIVLADRNVRSSSAQVDEEDGQGNSGASS